MACPGPGPRNPGPRAPSGGYADHSSGAGPGPFSAINFAPRDWLKLLISSGSAAFPAVQPLFQRFSRFSSGSVAFPAVQPLSQRFTRFSSGAFACVAIFPAVHPFFCLHSGLYAILSGGPFPAVYPLLLVQELIYSGSSAPAAHPLYVPSGSSASPSSGSSALLRQRFTRL